MICILNIALVVFCGCCFTCYAKVYDSINDVWVHDDMYMINAGKVTKISAREVLSMMPETPKQSGYEFGLSDSRSHNSGSLAKRMWSSSRYGGLLSPDPQWTDDCWHDNKRSFDGYDFPIRGKKIIDCNVQEGCQHTITETFTKSNTISVGGDVTLGLGKTITEAINFAVKATYGNACTETVTSTTSNMWKLRQGGVGSVGIYPKTKWCHGITYCRQKTPKTALFKEGEFHYTDISRTFPTTVKISQKDCHGKLDGILSFFYR